MTPAELAKKQRRQWEQKANRKSEAILKNLAFTVIACSPVVLLWWYGKLNSDLLLGFTFGVVALLLRIGMFERRKD